MIETLATAMTVGVIGKSVCFHAISMVATEVKARRKTVGGLVTST